MSHPYTLDTSNANEFSVAIKDHWQTIKRKGLIPWIIIPLADPRFVYLALASLPNDAACLIALGYTLNGVMWCRQLNMMLSIPVDLTDIDVVENVKADKDCRLRVELVDDKVKGHILVKYVQVHANEWASLCGRTLNVRTRNPQVTLVEGVSVNLIFTFTTFNKQISSEFVKQLNICDSPEELGFVKEFD